MHGCLSRCGWIWRRVRAEVRPRRRPQTLYPEHNWLRWQVRLDLEEVRAEVEAATAAAYRCSRSGGDPGVAVRPSLGPGDSICRS